MARRVPRTGFCERAPRGWWCSRDRGHDGPCAAHPCWWNLRWQLRPVQDGSRVNIDKAALWITGLLVFACGLIFGFLIGVLTLV